MLLLVMTASVLAAVSACAQGKSSAPPARQQIAAAVLAAPQDLRDGATVLGYSPKGKLMTLRKGPGEMVCLASDPSSDKFHVACYHRSLEPFMARGRALRDSGVSGDKVDSLRFAEVKAGTLALPSHPASLYTLTGPKDAFDTATGTTHGAEPLYVVYLPYATAATTGISEAPVEGAPWIMDPGTVKAHIMFIPKP
jgi:hypothetical protein